MNDNGRWTTVTKDSSFVLVQPKHLPARTGLHEVIPYPVRADFDAACDLVQSATIVAVDFETRGNDISDDLTRPVGIGLATESKVLYLGLSEEVDDYWLELIKSLLCHRGLIAHNVQFDGGILEMERRRANAALADDQQLGFQFPWQACTYGLYMQLANEGWTGQRWGLKDAMLDVLLWEDTNEAGIDAWLIENGYANESGNPIKAEMWRCPPEILGKYCCLDADACYLLFIEALCPVTEKFDELVSYHQGPFLNQVRQLIDAKFDGMRVDTDKLQAHLAVMKQEIVELRSSFFTHPQIAPIIQRWRQRECAKLTETAPAKMTKKGEVSKSYEKWVLKRKEILDGTHHKIRFNINSTAHMRWVFYHNLYRTEIIQQPNDKKLGKARITLDNGDFFDVYLTKTGQLPVGKKVVPRFGEVGQLLYDHAKLIKEAQYVESYIKLARDGRLYPSFKSPGTITGRLSGKDPNLQQVPKTPAVLECFTPDPGWVLIDFDISALEQVVLAELSRDAALLKLYGPDANPNHDVYLFNACNMGKLGTRVREYYDMDSPTAEQKHAAKEHCSKERKISKACLAEGTPVRVKGKGWVPIEKVEQFDLIWDGVAWACCEDVLDKGAKVCYDVCGLYMTEDHYVKTTTGWQHGPVSSRWRTAQYIRPKFVGGSWADVWGMARTLIYMCTPRWLQIC